MLPQTPGPGTHPKALPQRTRRKSFTAKDAKVAKDSFQTPRSKTSSKGATTGVLAPSPLTFARRPGLNGWFLKVFLRVLRGEAVDPGLLRVLCVLRGEAFAVDLREISFASLASFAVKLLILIPFASLASFAVRLWIFGASPNAPPNPFAQPPPHHHLQVLPLEPRQLLREHRDALAPGAGHARDVGAPEHARGAEGVEDLLEIGMNVAVRPRRARVARRAGGLHRDVGVAGEREEIGEVGEGRLVLHVARARHVIDEQAQPRMLRGDRADGFRLAGTEQPYRHAGLLRRRPHPLGGAVGEPVLLAGLEEGEAQPA